VEDHQSCMLTATCLIGYQNYSAEGIAEMDVELVILLAETFQTALAEFEEFQVVVMHSIGQRIADLMALIEDVAFRRMDVRIARLLLARSLSSDFFQPHTRSLSDLWKIYCTAGKRSKKY